MAPKASSSTTEKTTSTGATTTTTKKKTSAPAAAKLSSSGSAGKPPASKKAAVGATPATTKKPAAKSASSLKTTTTANTTKKKSTKSNSGVPGDADMAKFRREGGTDMEMAEGGEMTSDAIVDAMSAGRGERCDVDPVGDDDEALSTEVVPVVMGEDPWGAKSRAEEWTAVVEEEVRKIVIEEDDVDRGSAAAAAVARVVDQKLEDSFAGEAPTPRAVVATDCGLSEFSMSEKARAVVVSLDLSGSKLTSLDTLVGGGWLWIRELKLSGNKFKGWPRGFSAMPGLLSLDVSFNPISLAGADMKPLAGLLRLELSGCDLANLTGEEETDGDEEDEEDGKDSVDDGEGDGKVGASRLLASPLSPLVSLVELNLSDNSFDSVASLAPLTLLPALRDVDLRENDVRDVRGYKKSMLEMLPELTRLDGDGTKQGKTLPRGRLEHDDSGTATVFGANVDRSSCSCVEGNPCVDATLCLDWKGRYTVAMMARRKKGYFGEDGTNVQYNMF